MQLDESLYLLRQHIS